MNTVVRYIGLLAIAKSALVIGATLEPLTHKTFSYPNGIPYQVSGSDAGGRGPQSGFNICNSTTEGPNSQCQTLILNSLDDFCMWSSNLNTGTDTIAEGEAREVAWCTKQGHGARIIPAGAITGAQWLYAKNYLQVVGFLDQTKVGLQSIDDGGELDPHGDDEQGNPLGGIVYTNGFGLNADKYAQQLQSNSNPSTQFTQVIEWVDFIGSGIFCLKMCNPSDPTDDKLCNHIYDRIGCTYNAVADYNNINGTFTVCDSEDMTPPGVYEVGGVTTTWFQPPEGVEPVPPYTPKTPASSNCHTFSSEQLFGSVSVTVTKTTPVSSSRISTVTSAGSSSTPTSGGSAGGGRPSVSGGQSPTSRPSPGSGSSSGSGASPTQTGAGISLDPTSLRIRLAFILSAFALLF